MKENKPKINSNHYSTTVVIICILSLFAIGCCGYLFKGHIPGSKAGFQGDSFDFLYEKATSAQESQEETESTEATESNESISYARLMCAGNNLIYQSIYNYAKTAGTAENGMVQEYDFSRIYSGIGDIISKADTALVSMSGPLTAQGEPVGGSTSFVMPSQVCEELYSIGFRVFDYGNCHVFDNGQQGVDDTIAFWKGKSENAMYTGVYSDEYDLNTIRLEVVNGISIAYLSFTEDTNRSLNETDTAVVVDLDDDGQELDETYTKIKDLIRTAGEQADIVVATMGFKDTGSAEPSESQKTVLGYLASFGADVVIGNGNSCIQPMEYIMREDGTKAVVAYSLGNLLSAESSAQKVMGGIADIVFSKSEATGTATVECASVIPIVDYYERGYTNYAVYRLGEMTEEMFATHIMNSWGFNFDYAAGKFDEIIGSAFLENGVKETTELVAKAQAETILSQEQTSAPYGVNIEESTGVY